MKRTLVMLFSLLSIVSCREDFDFVEAYRENPEFVYRENFEKAFGSIDPDQSWDFTKQSSTRAAGDVSFIEESGVNFGVNTPTTSGSSIVNGISSGSKNKTLYDKLNNQTLGGTLVASFESNGDEFTILPITTQCDYKYKMYVKVGDGQKLLFTKDWTDGSYAYCNQMATRISTQNEKIGTWIDLEGVDQTDNHKVYTIQSKSNSSYYLNHSNTGSTYKYMSTTPRQYALVDVAGTKYLIDAVTGEFLKLSIGYQTFLWVFKIPYPNLQAVSNILDASPVTKSGDYIIINSYYIFNNGKNSGLGAKLRIPWLFSEPYQWTWNANTLTSNLDKINSALTTTTPIPIRKSMPGVTINARIGEKVEIYIEKIDDNGEPLENAKFGSENKKVIALSGLPEIADLNNEDAEESEKEEMRYYGIDGNNDDNYNDLVFAVINKKSVRPEIKDEKRYMVEDLGAVESSDIDFNDVVVDFETSYTITGIVPGTVTKQATVRALGGTKNLSVFMGKVVNGAVAALEPSRDVCIFTKDAYIYGAAPDPEVVTVNWNKTYAKNDQNSTVKGDLSGSLTATVMYNTVDISKPNQAQLKNCDKHYDTNDFIARIDLSKVPAGYQWNPSLNNIYVVVYGRTTTPNKISEVSAEGDIIKFPNNGDIPEMIATPISWDWNLERCSVFRDVKTGNYAVGSYVKLVKE